MRLIARALGFAAFSQITAEFVTEKQAKSNLNSRQKRNNDEMEWIKSSIDRECIQEDCNFEEFNEAAENSPSIYGPLHSDLNRGNAMTAFNNFYTENPDCGMKNSVSKTDIIDLMAERKNCLKFVGYANTHQLQWQNCECDNGLAVKGKQCYIGGKTLSQNHGYFEKITSNCQSCEKGYHRSALKQTEVNDFPVVGSKCKTNVCRCSNGRPATNENCVTHDQEVCVGCDSGFYMTAEKTCAFKECICENGIAVTGINCANHGDRSCASCSDGYHWADKNKGCRINVCKCEGGYPAEGKSCLEHNSQHCVKFEAPESGFQKNSGLTDSGPSSQKDSHCRKHHKYTNGKCVPSCACADGKPARNAACKNYIKRSSDNVFCEKGECDTGFHWKSGNCAKNECKCPKGTETTGADCLKHGAVMCESCDRGYYEKKYKCKMNRCTCENGKAKKGRACKINGSENCGKCNNGFVLNRGICLTKKEACKQAPLDLQKNESF